MNDPRTKNQWPDANSASEYLFAYQRTLSNALEKISAEAVEGAFACLKSAVDQGNRIYLAGNGGSSAVSSHFCCDFMKGTYVEGEKPVLAHSLSDNVPLLTALANDMGYENSFSQQVKMLGKEGDVLVLISSSGNSPNVVRAAQEAHRKKMKVVSMTGFSGGQLSQLSDFNLYVPVNNYGMVEDAHQMLMHALSQYLFIGRDFSLGTSEINRSAIPVEVPAVGHT